MVDAIALPLSLEAPTKPTIRTIAVIVHGERDDIRPARNAATDPKMGWEMASVNDCSPDYLT
ncbi:MAG: hypothetical protein MZU95_11905 [Desulfomicrobium escambiense]|nr:hypothetical protein [Desulfomicrobium escambiense]